MSYCLIKKSIELIDKDLNSCSESEQIKSKKQLEKQHANERLKKRNLQQFKKSSGNFSQRKVKNSVRAYEKLGSSDLTSDNLRYLKKIDDKLNFNADALKVRDHHFSRISKKKKCLSFRSAKKLKKNTASTVFTERDFERINNKWLSLK